MKRLFVTVALIMFVCTNSFAQTINLEEARLLALLNSRSLAQYNIQLNSILSERHPMLPSVSAGYSVSAGFLDRNWGFTNPIDSLSASLNFSITQMLFEGGKTIVQKALKSISTESARNTALAEYFNVLDSVDNAYYAVLEGNAALMAAEASLQTALFMLSMAEIRQANGMINQGDYLRALADKESRENSRNQARRNLSLTMTRFKALAGITETPELEEIDFGIYESAIQHLAGISDEDADVLYASLLGTLLPSNLSLASAALRSQRAESDLTLARLGFLPTISARITVTGPGYTTANGFSSPSSGGSVSITGSIPIDFWNLQDNIRNSQTARDSAARDYTGALSTFETDLQSALINLILQAESVLSSRRSLEYTEKHFEYVMERYRLSQSSVYDLGEASTQLITSRNSLSRASYGFLQSLSRLRSLGAFDDEERLLGILLGAN